MRCLVTAGPTCEPLDAVRRLTNFSTGRLGTELALALAGAGHQVLLLRGESASWPAPVAPGLEVRPFTTTASLGEALAAAAGPGMDAVFHAAAVSDFAFGRVWRRAPDGGLVEVHGGKFCSRAGPLLAELAPTPKLIARLRGWFPRAWLAGWKYEVDGDRAAALAAGAAQIRDCATDACVVNGPAYGEGFGLLTRAGTFRHCGSREELLAALLAAPSGGAA